MIAPPRHLHLLSKPPNSAGHRQNFGDRLLVLVHEIEAFLMVCSYEEMYNFWEAVTNLRHRLHKSPHSAQVPQFLSGRRQTRDFCRILEVLADLPYPQMHLSNHGDQFAGAGKYLQKQGCEAQFHVAMPR